MGTEPEAELHSAFNLFSKSWSDIQPVLMVSVNVHLLESFVPFVQIKRCILKGLFSLVLNQAKQISFKRS